MQGGGGVEWWWRGGVVVAGWGGWRWGGMEVEGGVWAGCGGYWMIESKLKKKFHVSTWPVDCTSPLVARACASAGVMKFVYRYLAIEMLNSV